MNDEPAAPAVRTVDGPTAPTGRGRRRRIVVGVTALVVAAVAVTVALVVWPDPPARGGGDAGLALEPSGAPAGAVRITAVDAPLVWVSSEHVEVDVTVANEGTEPAVTRVWWLLAHPDDPDPWVDPVVQPEPVARMLEVGSTERVTVPIDAGLIEPGPYRLSAWVHTYDSDTEDWHHADGRTLQSAVRVTAPSAGLSHIGGTSDRMWIQAVAEPRSLHAGEPATVTVTVANAGAELASVQAWWFLSPTASETPWDVEGSVRSEPMSATADPGELTDLVVPIGRLPAAGTWRLTVWLHQQETVGGVPRDGVLVDQAVRIPD